MRERHVGYDIPDTEPTELVAGESWQWNKVLADYPPSEGWQLTYLFRGPTDLDAEWDSEVTSSGETYQVRIGKDATALNAGRYRLIGRVDSGTERHYLDAIVLTVRANPETAVDAGTHAERTLAVIDAALEGRLSDDEEEWQIAGRAVKHIPIDELRRLQKDYRQEVFMERNPERPFQSVEAHFYAP